MALSITSEPSHDPSFLPIPLTDSLRQRIEELSRARDAGPRDRRTHYRLLNALALTGLADELAAAEAVYLKRCGTMNPAAAINTLGGVGRYESALRFGSRRLKKDFVPKVAASLADTAMNANDTQKVTALLQDYARGAEEPNRKIRRCLVRLDLQKRDAEAARTQLLTYMAHHGRDARYAFLLSLLSLSSGQLDQAELYAIRNSWLNKYSAVDVLHLMRIMQARGKAVQAQSRKLDLMGANHWDHDSSHAQASYSQLVRSVLPAGPVMEANEEPQDDMDLEALVTGELKAIDDVIKTGLSSAAFAIARQEGDLPAIDEDLGLLAERIAAARDRLHRLARPLVFTEQAIIKTPFQSLKQRAAVLNGLEDLLDSGEAQASGFGRLAQRFAQGQRKPLPRLCQKLSLASAFL